MATATMPDSTEPQTDPQGEVEEAANPKLAHVIETTMAELAISPKQKHFTEDQLALLAARGMRVDKIPPAALSGFMALCLYRGVNPFIGEATIMQTEDGWAAIMQMDGFRTKAEETGEYRGTTEPQWCGDDLVWHEAWPDSWGEPVAARVGVRRRQDGETVVTYGVAHTEEYKVYEWVQVPGKDRGYRERRPTKSWREGGQLRNMISKCAKAAAFRDAFPRILAGFYAPEEMEKVRAERREAELARAREEGTRLRAEKYAAAQEHPEVIDEGVVEGVVVKHQGAGSAPDMDAVVRLRERATQPTPEAALTEEPLAAVEEEPPPTEDEPTPEVDDSEPLILDEDTKVALLRAELDFQAEILNVPTAALVKRWEDKRGGYGVDLGGWDSTMLLRVVVLMRKTVAGRLGMQSERWAQATAYSKVRDDAVAPLDELLGLA